jgi:hypothetical protein
MCRIKLEGVIEEEGSIPETAFSVVKDQEYCGEVKVALTFNPEVHLSFMDCREAVN